MISPLKKKKPLGEKSQRLISNGLKRGKILKVPRALMRASQQADQRATSHRSALDFRFSVYSVFRGVCLARRSEATPTCIKTSTRHGAKKDFFDKKLDIFNREGFVLWLNSALDGIQNNYNPTKAYSSVYWTKKWYQFWRKTIKIVED